MKIVKKFLSPLFRLLILTTLIISCNTITTNSKKNKPKIKSKHEKVANLIHKIYKTSHPYKNLELKNQVFSESLYTLIADARIVEKKSLEDISEKQRNTLKPSFLIESEIFASLYEGYSTYSILKVTLEENKYLIDIKFTNDDLLIKEQWIDKLVIINENGLKLDNVIYNKNITGVIDLKTYLANFSQEYYNSVKISS